jgi:hypothetical protein
MTQSVNPLRQFFRQPAIYLTLPTKGEFWHPDAISMPENKELPVLPMTAIDEITYRTPDALFNGQAVINVIQSCLPNVLNAWAAPAVDINAILVAIRIASYGHEMAFGTTCPACTHTEEYQLDLRNVLAQLDSPDFGKTIRHGDMEIFFRPITYKNQTDTNQTQFEEQRTIQQIPGSDLPDEEKLARLNQALRKITELTVQALKHSIAGIRTPDTVVVDPGFIQEFLNNCDRKLFNTIRDHVIALRTASELKPLHLKCTECEHEYDQPLTLDQASFFEAAS